MGFTFDDTDKKGVASPLSEMDRLVKLDSKNEEAIFPYIGGAELNSSPTHAHHRYVINFWDYPLRRDTKLTPSWDKATDKRKKQWLQAELYRLTIQIRLQRIGRNCSKLCGNVYYLLGKTRRQRIAVSAGGTTDEERRHFLAQSRAWTGC